MKQNIFLKRYQKKSDIELNQVLENSDKYVEEAITAAKTVLEHRKNKDLDVQNEKTEIKIQQKELISDVKLDNSTIAIEKTDFVTDDPKTPELYTKATVTIFTVVFGVIFGTVLLMYNFKKTNNYKAIVYVLLFGILYTVLALYILNIVNANLWFTIMTNLAAAGILTGVFWHKFIGNEFEHRSKDWMLPAVISLFILAVIFLFLLYIG